MILDKDKYKNIYNNEIICNIREKIINSFKDLEFVENCHKYYINNTELSSVSKTVERFYEPYDSISGSESIVKKYFNDSKSKYYQKSQQIILDEWNEISTKACDFGHEKHSFGEDVFHLLTQQYSKISRELVGGNLVPKDGYEENIIKFWNSIPETLVPVLSEAKVYTDYYAGTFDLLLVDTTTSNWNDSLVIADYKTNKDLFKNFHDKRMLKPLEKYLDNSYSHYMCQLSLYQIPLNNLGFKVCDRLLVHILPDAQELIWKLNDVSVLLNEYLKNNI